MVPPPTGPTPLTGVGLPRHGRGTPAAAGSIVWSPGRSHHVAAAAHAASASTAGHIAVPGVGHVGSAVRLPSIMGLA